MEYTEQQIKEAMQVFSCTEQEAKDTYIAKLEADKASHRQAQDNLSYRFQRANEYPPIGDQLDALWKGGDAAAAMLARIEAVKEQYPKPTGGSQ
jgi:hypothetical protein